MQKRMKAAGMWKSAGVSHGTSHKLILSENFLPNEKDEDRVRSGAARMGAGRERRWRYFTSITVQFILFKLFFRETQKEWVYYRWDCLQMLHISPHLQLRKDPKLPGKAPIWAAVTFSRCRISTKFGLCSVRDLFFELWILLSGIILHFIHTTPSQRTRQHQKRQNFKHNINTSNIKWSTNCFWDKRSREIYRKT